MEKGDADASIDILPNEVLYEVLDRLMRATRCRFAHAQVGLVCRRWRALWASCPSCPSHAGGPPVGNDRTDPFDPDGLFYRALAYVENGAARCLAGLLNARHREASTHAFALRIAVLFDAATACARPAPVLGVLRALCAGHIFNNRMTKRAVEERRWAFCQWLVDERATSYPFLMEKIVMEGSADMVRWIGEHHDRDRFAWEPWFYGAAMVGGDARLFAALWERSCPIGRPDQAWHAKRGVPLADGRTLQLMTLVDFCLEMGLGVVMMRGLMARGVPLGPRSYVHALYGRDLDCLALLYRRRHRWPSDDGQCWDALAATSDAVRDWVRERALHVNRDEVIRASVACKSLSALNWYRRRNEIESHHIAYVAEKSGPTASCKLRSWLRCFYPHEHRLLTAGGPSLSSF
jgi:hypothetical protein